MREVMVFKRLINIFLIVLINSVYTVFLCIFQKVGTDEAVLCGVLTIVFCLLFLYFLEHERLAGRLYGDSRTTLGKVVISSLTGMVLVAAGVFLPEFLAPVFAAAVLMKAFSTITIALCEGVFFSVLFCLTRASSAYEMLLYCLLVLFGVILSDEIEEGKFTFWRNMLIPGISVLLPGVFYYLGSREVGLRLFLYGAIEGIVLDYLLLLLHGRMVRFRKRELETKYKKIMDESHPLARALVTFSDAEAAHALHVSAVAAKCARLLGVNERVCEAAGYYYRIGIILGKDIAENGVILLEKNCFPEEVIRIVSEYGGVKKKPSTVESAIVHMVDGLLKRTEVLQKKEVLSGAWNQEMMIYKTLNDFSASGIYDESGLGMNHFLRIRGFLVKEELL